MDSHETRIQSVTLSALAPQKPPMGEPCNGCGICCAAEPCPLSRLVFRRRHGSCAALEWCADEARYYCGLVRRPRLYLRWLPLPLAGLVRRAAVRWVAAGAGCDSDVQWLE